MEEAWENAIHPPHGTINCIALNEKGEMSAVTTTSGLAWKIPGRVGDSPIIGGGLWLDQDVGGAGSTGRGEENLRVCGAHTVVENMRHGMTPKDACLDALKRVSRNFDDDMKRLEPIDLNFYALRKDGQYAGAALWNKASVSAARGAQFVVCEGGRESRPARIRSTFTSANRIHRARVRSGGHQRARHTRPARRRETDLRKSTASRTSRSGTTANCIGTCRGFGARCWRACTRRPGRPGGERRRGHLGRGLRAAGRGRNPARKPLPLPRPRTMGMVEKAAGGAGRRPHLRRHRHAVHGAEHALPALRRVASGRRSCWRRRKSLLTMPDLLNYWLAGVQVCEYTEATTTQFLDRRTRGWAVGLLSGLGIPTHFLKPIVQPGAALGGLRAELAQAEALKAAVVIAPACHDTGSAVAAVRTGGTTAFLSSGTWSLFGTEVPDAIVSAESRRFNFTNEGGVGGTYRLLKNITGCGCWRNRGRCGTGRGADVFLRRALRDGVGREPARTPIDPDDALFTAPEDMPRAIDAFCARTGQPAPRTPGAYTRVILESLALKYRAVLEQLGAIAGARFEQIRVIGGGCRNAMLNQFTADATGCRVLAGPAEATALGNIAMQLVGTGAVALRLTTPGR